MGLLLFFKHLFQRQHLLFNKGHMVGRFDFAHHVALKGNMGRLNNAIERSGGDSFPQMTPMEKLKLSREFLFLSNCGKNCTCLFRLQPDIVILLECVTWRSTSGS